MGVQVLFIARATLYRDKGGDTVQILNTASFLRKYGLQVTVRLTNEVIDYSAYDLIHFFNIIRPADILYHVRKSGKPYVVSPIFVDYTEYDRKIRNGASGFLFHLIPSSLLEYAKTMARAILGREKIVSKEYIFKGHRRSVRDIIKRAAMLLPNSHSEYKRLVNCFGLEHPYRVIPNAVDAGLFVHAEVEARDKNLVLCVGRIEGRKNQLNLIKAINNLPFRLLIIGASAVNQRSYYQKCLETAGANIEFIENISQEKLISYYRRAKVHALPSWFETTGLSSLEAAVMGCNVVITDKGDTREYFEDMAFYCDPASPASIGKAIARAMNSPVNPALIEKILDQYTWENTALKTWETYNEVLAAKH